MNKLDSVFDKAIAAGKELAERKEMKSREMQEATDAVSAAAAEMEKAAIDGNETAYAKAKEKRNTAENRLEILQIRARSKTTTTDWIKEAAPILDELRKNSVAEIRKMIQDFCSKDAELLKVIESIDEYAQKYNQVMLYFKSHVFRDPNWNFKVMGELLPIVMVLDFQRKFDFQRDKLRKAVDYK